MENQDLYQPFIFESLGIRGEIVRLGNSFRQILGNNSYPVTVAKLLGESLCASVLLSVTIKFDGSLILQIQSPGTIKTLVAQSTNHRIIRGLAHWSGTPNDEGLMQLCPNARLVITIQTEGNDPYQGIVAVERNTLPETIEQYFAASEQIPTRLWMQSTSTSASGLLLQALPGQESDPDGWNRINLLTESLTKQELRELPFEEILFRLYNQERVRIFDPEPVVFRCNCTREKVERVLIALGESEALETLAQEGEILVHCEFCNRKQRFDAVDIGSLFKSGFSSRKSGSSRH